MYKVLFLGWEYYPVFTGGLGVVCKSMAEEMANQGMEVYVALPSIPKTLNVTNLIFPDIYKDYEHKSYSVHKNIKLNYSEVILNPYFSSTSAHTSSDFQLYEKTSKNNGQTSDNDLYGDNLFEKINLYKEMIHNLSMDLEFDVIHAHDWMTYLAAIEAREVTGKKCVLHVHATEFDRTGGNPNEIIFNIEKDMLKKADRVIAISDYNKKVLTDQYDIDGEKISIVHNALATEQYNSINDKLNWGKGKTVMFLGRAVVQKGVEKFVEVAAKVKEVLPDTKFVFAGDGELLPEVIQMTAHLNLQENFIFTGSVDRYKGDLLYNNADLFVMTSVSEPFGITALEAINQGTPVLLSKTSGAAEVLPNAITVDFWDIEKFADVIVNMLMDDDLYHLMKENQEKDYAKITWKDQVERISNIYHNLVNSEVKTLNLP